MYKLFSISPNRLAAWSRLSYRSFRLVSNALDRSRSSMLSNSSLLAHCRICLSASSRSSLVGVDVTSELLLELRPGDEETSVGASSLPDAQAITRSSMLPWSFLQRCEMSTLPDTPLLYIAMGIGEEKNRDTSPRSTQNKAEEIARVARIAAFTHITTITHTTMSPLLKEYLRQRVVIVTTSGECFTATLEGFDRSTNLVLADIRDRFASQDGPVLSSVQVLRGSEVVLVGLYEPAEGEEARAALLGAKAAAIHDTKNKVDNEHLIWKAVGEATRHKTTKRRKVGE